MVQWLGLFTFIAKVPSSTSDWGTKILQTTQCGQKNKKQLYINCISIKKEKYQHRKTKTKQRRTWPNKCAMCGTVWQRVKVHWVTTCYSFFFVMLFIFNQKKWTGVQKPERGRYRQHSPWGNFSSGVFREKKCQKGMWLREAIWLRAEDSVGLSAGAGVALSPQSAE